MPPVNSPNSADQPPFWSLKPWWCQPWSILSTGVDPFLSGEQAEQFKAMTASMNKEIDGASALAGPPRP